MSTALDGVGLRMLSVRKKHALTQAIVAEQLEISTRTYIFYEQQKRELPAGIALRFCDLYGVEISWLLTGENAVLSDDLWGMVEEAFFAVLTLNDKKKSDLSPEKLSALAKLVAEQSITSSKSPSQVAEAIFAVV